MVGATEYGGDDLDLIDAVSRDVVEALAPVELPLFPATSQRLRERPKPAAGSGRDDILGFGPADVVSFMTPVIWLTTAEVVSFVGLSLKDAAAEHTGSAISKIARRAFRGKSHDKEPPVRLTPSQLAEVRAVALNKGLALKLPREQAQLLADALTGTLAIQG